MKQKCIVENTQRFEQLAIVHVRIPNKTEIYIYAKNMPKKPNRSVFVARHLALFEISVPFTCIIIRDLE